MGRHSDKLTNYKFSTHVYVVIACLVVAVIIIVFWVKAINGDSTTDKSKCLAGDLTVKIASSAGAESLAANVIDQYNESVGPFIRLGTGSGTTDRKSVV